MTRCRRVGFVAGGGVLLPFAVASPAQADLPGTGIVKDVIGGATGWTFDTIASGIGGWVLGAVSYFVEGALGFLRTAARPDVEAAWFAGPGSPYAAVRGIAVVLLAGFVLLGLIQGLVHGDPAGMLRRVAGNLPLAVGGMVVTTAVVGRLLALTDALSDAVLAGTGDQALHFLSGFGVAVSSASQGFAAVVLGLVAVIAALLLWVELIVRAALVHLLVAISPIGFAATLWPAARGLLRKTVEILLAVIVSKFVICVALAIGVAALGGAGGVAPPLGEPAAAGMTPGVGASLSTLLVGAVVLGLAAFAPFLVLKLIPVAESALVAQGVSRSPARAVQSGAATYSSARSLGRLGGSGTSGSAPPASAGGSSGSAFPSASRTAGASAGGSGGAAGAGAAAGVGAAAAQAGRVPAQAARQRTTSQVDASSATGGPTPSPAPRGGPETNGKERR